MPAEAPRVETERLSLGDIDSGAALRVVDSQGRAVRMADGDDDGVEALRLELLRCAHIKAREEVREKREAEKLRGAGGARKGSVNVTSQNSSSRNESRRGSASNGGQERKKSVAERDEERRQEAEAKAEERRRKISITETTRAERQSKAEQREIDAPKSKYKRSEIMILKELFEEFDVDGSDSVSVGELRHHFKKRVEEKVQGLERTRFNGKRITYADRHAVRARVDLLKLVEPMFAVVDTDRSGEITFFELLKATYPFANDEDFATFKNWAYPPKPYVPPIQYVLSQEQKEEVRCMFKVIDTDRNGELSVHELKDMFVGSAVTGATGISMEELQQYFDEVDFDDDDAINHHEFELLMISTGLFTPEELPHDVTEEQLERLREEQQEEEAKEKKRKAALKLRKFESTKSFKYGSLSG